MKLHRIVAASVLLGSLSTAALAHDEHQYEAAQARNIIYVIGDGMGFEYISAYRYAFDDPSKPGLSATAFDDLLKGSATTYPDDDTWVTDSAAGATALATGVKSYNGAIGVDANKHPQQTLMELAREQGWSTAAVSTSQVTHATPASFFTHHPSRKMYDAIADSLATPIADGQWSFDVLLGGGYDNFNRDDKNWLPELKRQGMTVVTEFDQLDDVQQTPVLGVFAPYGLPHAIDDDAARLSYMTKHALRLLTERRKPFALMIEGSQIDWCGHANDIACAVNEMHSLNLTLKVIKQYLKAHPDTLLVVTADHSTGGLTLGRDGIYQWHAERVRNINASIAEMSRTLVDMPAAEWREYLKVNLALKLSDEQWQQLLQPAQQEDKKARQQAIRQALVAVTAKVTGTGWTTSGHTAVDVPVLAAGPGAEHFSGYMDNTDIAKALFKVIGGQNP
ncbi:alkaline phosphatase [Idiomarina xiamenensis]|uniref:Alkaline phosphatase n=1 Tax=Idiomarina xiamenensis 10-D-4 TaxID=740709 RepID=K2KWS6_9GAMM|nr:alkaline phosphatase [Idiomarina xiamenensis]EKE82105.1 alkaline phosphatase [Idiomarina xiamenensis 10-D-4]